MVAYRDIFGRPHVTQFCTALTDVNFVPQTKEVLWTWSDIQALGGVDGVTQNFDAIIARLATFKPKGRMQTRSWMPAMVLLDCGLRISEALTLDRDNVDLDNLALRVRGKGDKERLVPISLELRKHLYRFLRQTSGRYVFAAYGGGRLERHSVNTELQHLCRLVGITTHVHAHGFRHAYAVHATKNGLDVIRLSRILGHSSINTTQIYLRVIGFEHLRDGGKRSPLSR